MREKPKKTSQPSAASIEANLFGTIISFHEKAMTLVRQASLDDDKLKIVADRIKTLLANVTTEMKKSQRMNVKEQLDAAHEELKRLVNELSGFPDGSEVG